MHGTHAPNPIDIHVGLRVRLRRKEMGFSQEKLADGLGLTFQQVQKYERGANRISASKLYETAHLLHVSIGFFFEGLIDPASPRGDGYASMYDTIVQQLLAEPNGRQLAEAFLRIKQRSVKKGLADLACEIAAQQPKGPLEPETRDPKGNVPP